MSDLTLFFSRGRGRGHAVPDLALANAIRRDMGAHIEFASYASGADVLREARETVYDLQCPEEGPFVDVLVAALALVASKRPSAVIAHEEFAVPPVCKALGIPCALLTDWFPPRDSPFLSTVSCADMVVFIGDEGVFPLPPAFSARIQYVGQLVRDLAYSKGDRETARRELGISAEALLVSVIPGAWATEDRNPIFDLVLSAFDLVGRRAKKLYWLAGRDFGELANAVRDRGDVVVTPGHRPVEQLMVASDCAITKGNRGSLFELVKLDVPTISLSRGQNPIDEIWTAGVPGNTRLNPDATTPQHLARVIEERCGSTGFQSRPIARPDAFSRAAGAVGELLAQSASRTARFA